MGLFNVRKMESEKLEKAIDLAKQILRELSFIERWVEDNKDIDVYSIASDVLKERITEVSKKHLGDTFAFRSEFAKYRYRPDEELTFEHEKTVELKEIWEEIREQSYAVGYKENLYKEIRYKINGELARREKIEVVKEHLRSIKNGEIPEEKKEKQSFGHYWGLELEEQYFVPKKELVQSVPREARNSKADLLDYYMENGYPSLVFSGISQKNEVFQEIENILKPYLVLKAKYERKISYGYSQRKTVLVVKKGLEKDLHDAVKLYKNKFNSMKIESAFINEQGYYPIDLLMHKISCNSFKTTSVTEKLNKKREQQSLLLENMKKGRFHTNQSSDETFLNEETKILVNKGFNKYVIAKLFGFPIEKLDIDGIETEENRNLLKKALEKHELEVYFEIALELLETDSDKTLWGFGSKLKEKYNISI